MPKIKNTAPWPYQTRESRSRPSESEGRFFPGLKGNGRGM